MNKTIIRNSLMVAICVLLICVGFFSYSFLTTKAQIMRTTNTELKDELAKLKEKQNSLKTEKSTLDKQYEELQQKLSKIGK
jgi:F0F1-type ATP synthase membrane subunit b/b'